MDLSILAPLQTAPPYSLNNQKGNIHAGYMSYLGQREIEFDILRSIIIISSIILHFDTNFDIRALSSPFSFIQNHFFTVGAFFFFTAGVMAYRVYIPRYREKSFIHSLNIAKKGLIILLIYFTYITVMRLISNTEFPSCLLDYIFKHPFFLKALFSFGILYTTIPFILVLMYRNGKVMYYFPILLYLIVIVSLTFLELPYWTMMIFIDRSKFLYALLPSYIIFFIGMLFGRSLSASAIEKSPVMFLDNNLALTSFIFYTFLLIINSLFFDFTIHNHASIAPIREAMTLCFCVILFKKILLKLRPLYRLFSNQKFVSFGVESLTTYVVGNMMVALIINYCSDNLVEKVCILCSILLFTYFVSTWKKDSRILNRRLISISRIQKGS
jgi:hypothetical protein